MFVRIRFEVVQLPPACAKIDQLVDIIAHRSGGIVTTDLRASRPFSAMPQPLDAPIVTVGIAGQMSFADDGAVVGGAGCEHIVQRRFAGADGIARWCENHDDP